MPKPITLLLLIILIALHKTEIPDSKRASDVRLNVWPKLQKELKDKGFAPYGSVYLRIIKDISVLEVWVKSANKYQLFKTYDVCTYSGGLGTKTRNGDGKSPEGLYTIEPKQLNPVSNYYLAINVGYPNAIEKAKGYTGSAIMVHGHCASIGCYAMTDARIEEIYTLVYEAFAAGQKQVRVDIFPFRMDDANLKRYAAYKQDTFWRSLKPAYELFEKRQVPVDYHLKGKEYAY
ncbi:L,D-transpeptidase family protein [Mucilaginibacter sp. cycad4]|uniref:L,D-transpeptidase family protein n=1 Tax=Mucilaginibacter sp. cycad4 TaxID=3342096 RepID=UPI002AAAD509|nr:L,D-transpeptidase family protein [Mucilaginibacter gossypii]WPU97650.1 L,D-transpeptidase family protein [Mucilaginibacter gossypii]